MNRLNEINEFLKEKLNVNEKFLKEMDSSSSSLACKIATYAHRNQKRVNGEDYVNHPVRCNKMYRKLIGLDDDSKHLDVDELKKFDIPYEGVEEVCLLHDVIEDTDFTLTDIEDIYNECGFKDYFNLYMKDALISITHKKEIDYEEYFNNLLDNKIASIVKLMDMHDNMDILSLTSFDKKCYERTNKYLLHSYVLNQKYHFIENIKKYQDAVDKKYKIDIQYMIVEHYGILVVAKAKDRYILFKKQIQKWVDETQYITDLIMGYDPSEPEDSPYRFGNDPADYDYITKEEAEERIGKPISEEKLIKIIK